MALLFIAGFLRIQFGLVNTVLRPGQHAVLLQPLVQLGNLAGLKFRSNTYFSDSDASALFDTGTRADRKELSFEGWVQKSGETDARFEKTSFPDAGRFIERYMQSLGNAPTHAAFIAAVRNQSKAHWQAELTASVINDWFRAGFGAKEATE